MKTVHKGIFIEINGDSGPFSKIGKSIGYRIIYQDREYLIDCGAPVFQSFGEEGIRSIHGIFITHSHDDHKRWFTDMALYKFYTPGTKRRLTVIATETIHEELEKSSMAALNRSLSSDSRRVVDINYDAFIHKIIVGPGARYKLKYYREHASPTGHFVGVVDARDRPVDPRIAKVVIGTLPGSRPRLLFKDPHYKEWVEPETFYPLSSRVFYKNRRNPYIDPKVPDLKVTPLKAPCWHGPPTVGYKIETGNECLIFGSDTIRDVPMWKEMSESKHPQKLGMSKRQFERSPVIIGNINNYVERLWSRERYQEAVHAFDRGITIHDIAGLNSVVHTDYPLLQTAKLDPTRTILTHSPDRMVADWILTRQDKQYRIIGDQFYELVGNNMYALNADIYCKDIDKFFVGYANARGKYRVFLQNGLLHLTKGAIPPKATLKMRVDLYQDLQGRYLPKLENKNQYYLLRPNGKVELITRTAMGSTGVIVKNERPRLAKIKKVRHG